MKKILGLQGGKDGTFFKVLTVKKCIIVSSPAIRDGEPISVNECCQMKIDEYASYKKKIELNGYCATIMGNGVMAEKEIQKLLGNEFSALSVSSSVVEIWKKSDYKNACRLAF